MGPQAGGVDTFEGELRGQMTEVMINDWHCGTRSNFILTLGDPCCLLLRPLGVVFTGILARLAYLQFFIDSQFHIILVLLFATTKTSFTWLGPLFCIYRLMPFYDSMIFL